MKLLLTMALTSVTLSGCLDLDATRFAFENLDASTDGGSPSVPSRDAGTCACDERQMPPPTCRDATTLETTHLRACLASGCQYEVTRSTCVNGCVNGACQNEPCAGVTCANPPAPTCLNEKTLQVVDPAGTCAAGVCRYASTVVVCAGGCAEGHCLDNPCTGVACTTPPPSQCLGSTLRTHASVGTCEASTGACGYAATDTACPNGCASAACLGDPCAGVQCTTPPAPTCVTGTSRKVYSASGTCANGACAYTASTETCAAGQQCDNGACVKVSVACSPATGSGCCQNDTCLTLDEQSNTMCGAAGSACAACGSGSACNQGQCASATTCGTMSDGGTVCSCQPGYRGDGVTCVAVGDQLALAGEATVCRRARGLNGAVSCWGSAAALGTNASSDSALPVSPATLPAEAADLFGAAVVTSAGAPWAWGPRPYSDSGQSTDPTPTVVAGWPGGVGVTRFARGDEDVFALSNGELWYRGHFSNSHDRLTPGLLASVGAVNELATSNSVACYLSTAGAAFCLGNPLSNAERLGSGRAGTFTSYLPQGVVGVTGGAARISVGPEFACVVMKSGDVRCWGSNEYGALGPNAVGSLSGTPVTLPGLKATDVSVSRTNVCAVSTAGTVWCWGDHSATPARVTTLESVKQVVNGGDFRCALKTNGEAWCWGRNNHGQLGPKCTAAACADPVLVPR